LKSGYSSRPVYPRDGGQTKGNETHPRKNPFPFVAAVAHIDIPMVLFTGEVYDSTGGLDLFPPRAYDPSTGRFVSEDPIPSINPYPYVQNDPVNLLDPRGAQGLIERALPLVRVQPGVFWPRGLPPRGATTA
jgi:RHS repeat-associated protein